MSLVAVCLFAIRPATTRVVQVGDMMITIPPQQRALRPNNAYLALCTLGKNVPPGDLLEWLVHHIALGVGHIYWYEQ